MELRAVTLSPEELDHLDIQLMEEEAEAQRGVATGPRSHSEAQDALRPPASQPRARRALRASPGFLKRQVADTRKPPNTYTFSPLTSRTSADPTSEPAPGRGAQAGQD